MDEGLALGFSKVHGLWRVLLSRPTLSLTGWQSAVEHAGACLRR